jgi:exonuclease SbcC
MGFKRLRIPNEIVFPDGKMLIFGRNESGKSTVMEAIHYGVYGLALRPSKKASNDDLINYGYPEAVIELVFSIDENEYTVKRLLKRTGTNIHELLILRPDGKKERVTKARTVNNQILEELHGIDSEALLNSCLVEQKELGKLEASVRAKRIEAMTSLLNIEAFVEAQQDLKKDSRDLVSKNKDTLRRLDKAEVAKNDYEEAEVKLEKAKSRIEDILTELEDTAKKLAELQEILAIIDRVKEINSVIGTNQVKLDGLNRELERILKSLKEAEEAEEIVKQLIEERPTAQLRFEEAELRYEALQKLQGLESQLENVKGEEKRARERLEEAERKVEEAEQASEQLGKLNTKFKEYEPAKIAQKLLPEIEENSQNIISSKSEIERLTSEGTELTARLVALEEADNKIEQLEEHERGLLATKSAASKQRTIGYILALVGIISVIGYSYSPYLLPVGGILVLLGAILIIRNSPGKFDTQLQELRTQRESLLGEKARITDFQDRLDENRRLQEENEKFLSEAENGFEEGIHQLPSTPREYSEILDKNSELQISVSSLRDLIQEDMQTLVKVTTERDSKKILSDELEERRLEKNTLSGVLEEQLSELTSLDQNCTDIEEEHGINTDQADSIKIERDESQKKLQELNTNLDTYQKKALQKESLTSDSEKVKGDIQGIEEESTKLRNERDNLLEENEIDLSEESELRKENDDLKENSVRLETEKNERAADVKEAETIMDETHELKEEYPKLVIQNDEEVFDLDAMKRAEILIEGTRDGIMSGVKKRIESHMIHFLPALTDDRYNMARIDEKDYRIEIFDRDAKRWRGKGVFSGATQDQFSLALRLAFALSTIPSSRGARPGFIFLDEPLSGFDFQRRKGFMKLLQEELPQYFDQIIVISHLEALQEEFPYNLQLEAGQIIQ